METPGREEYQIAIICALGTESEAVEGLFDELYETKSTLWQRASGDRNTYTTGRIGRQHYVVVAHMPQMGKVHAANTATGIRATFPNIGLALVVGVCGGSPSTYLGDVIVSTAIVQADFGREHLHGFLVRDHSEGNLGNPSPEIQSFLRKLQTRNTRQMLGKKFRTYAKELCEELEIDLPSLDSDRLFSADYIHRHRVACEICTDSSAACGIASKATCVKLGCGPEARIRPAERPVSTPEIHFGPFCSTDTVQRNAKHRDELISQYNVVGFEMEGAGVWENLPALVVKGICDYADSHKNKKWQSYAAIVAAALSKAVIEEYVPVAISRGYRPNSLEGARESCLSALDFDQKDSRLHEIDFAHSGTCEWIFESTELRAWLSLTDIDKHDGVLWIKGKPGAGKSVLMKHIFQATHLFEGLIRVGFFFHARGSDLQRNLLGLYRSILFQLLQVNDVLLDKFMSAFLVVGMHSQNQWTVTRLQHFILLCSRQGWIQDTVIFIDALDECNHDDARSLVSFCEDLASNSRETATRLLICFSIRHFPNISMRRCVTLNLDRQATHDKDIERYIQSKLRAPEFVARILANSKGIFLWAALVTQILNTAYDEGATIRVMDQKLAKIPSGLDAIFNLILEGDMTAVANARFMLCLVLHAQTPLSPEELYELYRLANQRVQNSDSENEGVEQDRAWKFILHTSKGLLELSGPFEFRRKVQFIHESVGDYLRDHITAADQNIMHIHENIIEACIQGAIGSSLNPLESYATSYIVHYIAQLSDCDLKKAYLCRINRKPFLFDDHDTLLAYVTRYREGKSCNAQELSRDYLPLVEIILNDIQMAIKPDYQSESEFVIQCLKAVIDLGVQRHWLDGFTTILEAKGNALDMKNDVDEVLMQIFGPIPRNASLQTLRDMAWYRCKQLADSQISIVSLLRIIEQTYFVTISWRKSMESSKRAAGFKAIGTTGIVMAVYFDDILERELLIKHGADLGAKSQTGWTPLALAICLGKTDVARLLLEHGAAPDVVCPITALPWLSRPEYVDDSSGPDIEIGLNLAIERGQIELITLLLEHGVNPYLVSERTGLDAFGVARSNETQALLLEYSTRDHSLAETINDAMTEDS